MDRANSKHSPRVDDQMAQETLGLTQGAGAGARAEEWHEPEPPAEGEPEPAPIPDIETDNDELSRFGRYIPLGALPGDRDRLMAGAQELNAPDDILAMLGRLEPDRVFRTVAEIWAATFE
jgi:Protein of unknown function (DUF2795)